jgi:hypothetical protein
MALVRLILSIFVLTIGINAIAFFDPARLEVRGGYFWQSSGRLASGGVFFKPSLFVPEIGDFQFDIALGVGAWMLKSKGGGVAPAIPLEFNFRTDYVPLGIGLGLFGGGGYAYILDQFFAEAGAELRKELPENFLTIDAVGLQGMWLISKSHLLWAGLFLQWNLDP